jgi:hypothetical protein
MKIENNGSSGWIVTDKKGVKYYFGTISASQENDPFTTSEIFKWFLDRVQDVNGNYMTVTYYKEQYKIYPSQIDYTGNGTLQPYAHVVFERETRPDQEINFMAGFSSQRGRKTNWRINQIKVFAENNLQRRYKLNYTQSPETNRSLLTSLQQYGSDDASLLPTMVFSYQNQRGFQDVAGSWVIPSGTEFSQYWNPSLDVDRGVRVVDINNDNYPDLVQNFENGSGSPTKFVWLNNGVNGWNNPGPWNVNATESVIQFDGTNSIEKDKGARYVDVDGDGWVDEVVSRFRVSGGLLRKSYLNDHTSTLIDGGTWALPTAATPPGGSDPVMVQEHATTPAYNEFLGTVFADVNGDGFVDYVRSSCVFLNHDRI